MKAQRKGQSKVSRVQQPVEPAGKNVNDFRFRNTEELAADMALSVTAIRCLQKWGAPFLAKKSHPRLLLEWMALNPTKVGKIE